MTTKRIVYSMPDGAVRVCCPAPEYIARLTGLGMTEDQAIAVVQAKDVPPDAVNAEVLEAAAIPTDRAFRNAWGKPPVGPPAVDLPKAREIQRQRIEVAREATMKQLLLREALGDNVAGRKAQVAAVNATAIVNAAQNEAALKNSKPGVLD